MEALGEHHAYFEPFCGSMAVLFAKEPVRHEVVNDLNGDLTNIAWVLQSRPLKARLLVRLHDTICSESHYRACRERVLVPFVANPDAPDWKRAYYALVTWWMGRNGMAGTRKSSTSFSARFTSQGGSGGVRFRSMVESVPAFSRRLARVDVLNRSGFDVLDKIEDESGAAIYLDPPYLKKTFAYEHDFKSEDHERLAVSVARFQRARVVISYYEEPRLADLYPLDHWEHRKIVVTKSISNTSSRTTGSTKATEVLLINRKEAK